MKGYFEKMKKFVLAFGIPVLAVASLIGSGYATWYFNSDVSTNYKDIALELKEKRVVGAEFQHTTGEISLVLDQPVKMMECLMVVRMFILKELSVSLW